MEIITYPDKKAFKDVCTKLETAPLTLEMVGDVFGKSFWMLLVGALMDASDAARAVQGAIFRLRQEDARVPKDGD